MVLLKKSKYKPRLITIVLILKKCFTLQMKLIKTQLLFKTNDLIVFINTYNNKRCKQNSCLSINYKVKSSFLAILHVYSIQKLWLIPFIRSTVFVLSSRLKIYKKLVSVNLIDHNSTYYSIKFNNRFYSLITIKSSYSFNYYQVKNFLYKTLSNIIKKPIKIT